MTAPKNTSLLSIVNYCNNLFQPDATPDWDGAFNGLQVENSGTVHKIAAAVDARTATIEHSIQAGADLLLVHHGLFWSNTAPWTGTRYRQMRLLLDNNLAIYSLHLPLDEHPRLGNNTLLCRALGFKQLQPFLVTKGRKIGFQSSTRIDRNTLLQRLQKATGSPALLLPGGPQVCRRIGVVTGGAGSELKDALAEGVDTFITGEGPHWTHAMAEDLGINVLYGGHYATETFGVKALAENLSQKFKLPWTFIDYPTGL
jgi:dinuclear metal center YbgI/SA1388 family protein